MEDMVLDLKAEMKKKIHIAQDYYEITYSTDIVPEKRLYFGVMLPYKVIRIAAEKKSETKTEMKPALITKGIIENGTRFETVGFLPPEEKWSLEDIRDYQNEWKAPQKEEVLEKLENVFREHCDLGGERKSYLLAALWAIGTYMHVMFNSYPYLSVRGPKRVGKTKFLSLLEATCFNGKLELNPSQSVTFRLIAGMRPTFIIDEFDYIDDEAKRVIMSLLRAGYKKSGGTVARMKKVKTKKGEDFGIEHFNLYSPKAFAAVWEIYDVADRCILLSLVPTLKKDVALKGIDPDEKRWIKLRDLLYRFALEYFADIRAYYEIIQNELGLDGRSWELWKPILAIAKFMGEFEYQEICELIRDQQEQKKAEEHSHREEIAAIRALRAVLKNDEVKEVMIAEISDAIREENEELYDFDDPKKRRRVHTRIGRVLSRLQIEKKRVGKGQKYMIRASQVSDLIERFNVEFEKENAS